MKTTLTSALAALTLVVGLSAGQAQLIAQDPQQGRIRIDVHRAIGAIDVDREHANSPRAAVGLRLI